MRRSYFQLKVPSVTSTLSLSMKLNVLLAKTDFLAASWKKILEEYSKFFENKQGAFRGEKKTYEPAANTVDLPNERSNKLVVTTVKEKLEYLEETSGEYIDALFAQEATNASGNAKAVLEVDGENLGVYSSLELLRMKTLLEAGNIKNMYENIPVYNEDELWNKTTQDQYSERAILESVRREGVMKTTMKESYILPDPNVSKENGAKYSPQVATKDTVIELGNTTFQKFTGEMSHKDRAAILARRSKLLSAVIEALKVANDVEAVPSQMTAKKLFDYLHGN